jgi:hypothetical protein
MLLTTGGCKVFNPDRQIETRTATRLVTPSPEVKRLLSAQRVQDRVPDKEVERFYIQDGSNSCQRWPPNRLS